MDHGSTNRMMPRFYERSFHIARFSHLSHHWSNNDDLNHRHFQKPYDSSDYLLSFWLCALFFFYNVEP